MRCVREEVWPPSITHSVSLPFFQKKPNQGCWLINTDLSLLHVCHSSTCLLPGSLWCPLSVTKTFLWAFISVVWILWCRQSFPERQFPQYTSTSSLRFYALYIGTHYLLCICLVFPNRRSLPWEERAVCPCPTIVLSHGSRSSCP